MQDLSCNPNSETQILRQNHADIIIACNMSNGNHCWYNNVGSNTKKKNNLYYTNMEAISKSKILQV